MSNNWWLYNQLKRRDWLHLEKQFRPLIVANKNGVEYRIYTPNPDEYIISVDVVQKAREMGANVISYPTTWCMASSEAIMYGKEKNIQIIPHGKLFEILDA